MQTGKKKRILAGMNWKIRITALFILLAGSALGYVVYWSEIAKENSFPFRYGLDLSGGTHLTYTADVSGVTHGEENTAMESLRDVIERRVNLFGVAEPVVQTERGSVLAGTGDDYRLVVELPGVTDVDAAVNMIGQTPFLDFRLEQPNTQAIIDAKIAAQKLLQGGGDISSVDPLALQNPYADTGLTGRYVESAQLEFNGTTNEPIVSLKFNDEGAKLFAQITRDNVGKTLAIYLDRSPISTPVIREEITGGSAQISGSMNPEEAKTLVGRLNSGALPVPITLASTSSVCPSLGMQARDAGVRAGIIGLLAVVLFMILWYRLPGFIASVALVIYTILMLAIFKLVPITLTAAGIAGFILSVGMAVDANILIFERMKEELRRSHAYNDERGETTELDVAVKEGFARAWTSIRDGNISSMISAVILFWFGTSIVQGFALTFGIGVLVSMFSAITISRTLLVAIAPRLHKGAARFFFNSGVSLR